FLLTFEKEETFFNLFKKGTLLGGIFLSHTLYGIFYYIIFISYEIWFLIYFMRRSKKESLIRFEELNQQQKQPREPLKIIEHRQIITQFLKRNFIIFIFILIIVSFYVINLLVEGMLISVFKSYLGLDFYLIAKPPNSFSIDIILIIFNLLVNLQSIDIFEFGLEFIAGFNKYYLNRNLSFFTFIFFIALFLDFKKHNELSYEAKNLIRFFIFSFIFIFLIFFTVEFLYHLGLPTKIHLFIAIIYNYEGRLLELFQGFWAIIFALIIKELIFYLNQYVNKFKIKKKSNISSGKRNNSSSGQYKTLTFIILIGIGSAFYINHLFAHHEYWYYSYYDDDDLNEVLLNAGEYFYDEYGGTYGGELKILLFENVDPLSIFDIIKLFEYLKANDSIYYNNTSFVELSDYINYNNADYAITPKYEITYSALSKIKNNFEVIFENGRYIFYKIK
ncbi:MAG: hypothetical protein ACTSQJ_13900, partial [Promethearchaeota archaeon]